MKRRSRARSYPAARGPLMASAVAACAVSLPGALSSQTLSLIAGANMTILANVDINPRYDPFYRSYGPNLGVGASFRLSPPEAPQSLWAQLSAVYAHKGAVMRPSSPLEEYAGLDFRLDYLELALLADMRFPSIVDGVFIHFLVGPSLGVLLSCEVGAADTEGDPPPPEPCLGDAEERGPFWSFGRLDAGVGGGAGLEVALTERVDLHASAQWTIGLGYVDEVDNPDMVDNPALAPALKNRALSLRAALAVPLG